jgi:hypothetical protein
VAEALIASFVALSRKLLGENKKQAVDAHTVVRRRGSHFF